MKNKGLKRILLYTCLGAGIEALVVLLTGAFGASPIVHGLLNAIKSYGLVWAWKETSTLGLICLSLLGFSSLLLIVNSIFSILKKKPILLLTTICLFLSMAFLPFLFLLIFPQADAGELGRKSLVILAGLLTLNIVSVILLAKPLKCLYCGKRDAEPAPAPVASKGLSELEIRAIVEDYIKAHEEEMHSEDEEEPAPAPVKEEPVEEPVEEPEEEEEEELDDEDDDENEDEEGEGDEFEEVEVVNDQGETVKIKRRKRKSFENKLRNSEYDIRHKYYDLRDYIKWYGLNNRISIPGDSFSYKRRKYCFITIVGKHIKFYVALDPDKYENSPIPVERATAKKFVDTPCVLRIKSDLSYRRAKLLVDDVMKEAGLPKPEGDEPKETQHPEKK